MDFYMYKSSCSRWWAIQNDIRYHMIIQPKKSYAALTHLTFHGQNTPYAVSSSSENKNDM